MEGKKTGFRKEIGKAYVFRFKNITQGQKYKIQEYCMSRQFSGYDRRGVLSFIFKRSLREDEFCDYCSEMIKNALVYVELMKDVEQIIPFDLYKKNREKMDFIWLIL